MAKMGRRSYIKHPRKINYDKTIYVLVDSKMLAEFKSIVGRQYSPKVRELMADYIARYKRDEKEKALLKQRLQEIEDKMDSLEIIEENYFKSEQWRRLNSLHQSIEKRIKELL